MNFLREYTVIYLNLKSHLQGGDKLHIPLQREIIKPHLHVQREIIEPHLPLQGEISQHLYVQGEVMKPQPTLTEGDSQAPLTRGR